MRERERQQICETNRKWNGLKRKTNFRRKETTMRQKRQTIKAETKIKSVNERWKCANGANKRKISVCVFILRVGNFQTSSQVVENAILYIEYRTEYILCHFLKEHKRKEKIAVFTTTFLPAFDMHTLEICYRWMEMTVVRNRSERPSKKYI